MMPPRSADGLGLRALRIRAKLLLLLASGLDLIRAQDGPTPRYQSEISGAGLEGAGLERAGTERAGVEGAAEQLREYNSSLKLKSPHPHIEEPSGAERAGDEGAAEHAVGGKLELALAAEQLLAARGLLAAQRRLRNHDAHDAAGAANAGAPLHP